MVSTKTILFAAQAIILVQAIPAPGRVLQDLAVRRPQKPGLPGAPGFGAANTTASAPGFGAANATASAAGPGAPASGLDKALSNTDCSSNTDSCSGDLTHYDGSFRTNQPGSCGTQVDTNGTNVIALPDAFMGPLSTDNPLCGRQITVFNPATGKTSVGTLEDKCDGCVDRSLDVTNHMFFELTGFNYGSTDPAQGPDPGRIHGVEWFFS